MSPGEGGRGDTTRGPTETVALPSHVPLAHRITREGFPAIDPDPGANDSPNEQPDWGSEAGPDQRRVSRSKVVPMGVRQQASQGAGGGSAEKAQPEPSDPFRMAAPTHFQPVDRGPRLLDGACSVRSWPQHEVIGSQGDDVSDDPAWTGALRGDRHPDANAAFQRGQFVLSFAKEAAARAQGGSGSGA